MILNHDPLSLHYDTPHTHYQHIEYWDNISGEKIINIPEGGNINLLVISKNSKPIIHINALYPHTTIHLNCLIVGTQTTHNTVIIKGNLKADHTVCTIHTIALLAEGSSNQLQAGVRIEPNTKGAEGIVTQENIILGKKTTIKTLPLLDVHTNDVKASHGATIQQLDKNKLFYLESKGLSSKNAKKLIIESYIHKAFEIIEGKNQENNINELKITLLQSLIS